MSDFFKMMWRKGLKILLIVVLVWILFFLINFFFPNFFNFLNTKNTLPSQSIEQKESIPIRYKIYNMFFKGEGVSKFLIKNNLNSTASTNTLEIANKKNQPYIWGDNATYTPRNTFKLNGEDFYIFINDDENISKNFEIDNIKIKKNGINNLSDNSIITGQVNVGYLSSYFFKIFIYNSDGDYLYDILANSHKDIKDRDILNITAINNKYNDSSLVKYKGDGFMVIWSDTNEVESILISKIKIN